MTHKELVKSAYRWVMNNTSCGFAFKEFYHSGSELADVIGFSGWEYSVLIECKASRSDFLADRKKQCRIDPETGLGKFRFYCCPNGLLKAEELPFNWGLIYVNEKGRARCVYNPYNTTGGNRWSNGFNHNRQAERNMLYCALRKLKTHGVLDKIYESCPK